MTQCDMILLYIHRNGSITQDDADKAFGCKRLAARIKDLKRAGAPISSTTEVGVNRFGKTTRYSRYRLTEPGTMAQRIELAEKEEKNFESAV